MTPTVVIYYMRKGTERHPEHEQKIAKAAFVSVSDALIFWNALSPVRRDMHVMETIDGEPVEEIAHTGKIFSGAYGHANAIIEKLGLPPRTRSREDAARQGWTFEPIRKDED